MYTVVFKRGIALSEAKAHTFKMMGVKKSMKRGRDETKMKGEKKVTRWLNASREERQDFLSFGKCARFHVSMQGLFDVLLIFQTNFGEMACTNGLHETQECRSTDECLAAAYDCLCACGVREWKHTAAVWVNIHTHRHAHTAACKLPGYELPEVRVGVCLRNLVRVSCRVFGLSGAAAWPGFNEPWTLSAPSPVSVWPFLNVE